MMNIRKVNLINGRDAEMEWGREHVDALTPALSHRERGKSV